MTAEEFLHGRKVFIQDLSVYSQYYGKKILVTGACGTIGHAIYQKFNELDIDVTGIDNDEYSVALEQDIILSDFVEFDPNGFDYVFHCAAFKHVTLAQREQNQKAVWDNNTSKFIKMIDRVYNPTKIILASTDKVTGNSYMGKTKREAENVVQIEKQTSLRLVNIAWSRGSVLDRWYGKHSLKICPPEVTRFWMQKEDAVYAMFTVGLMSPGLYTVWDVPKFTMGEIKVAWRSEFGGDFENIPLGREEAFYEKLISDDEDVEGDHPYIKRILQS